MPDFPARSARTSSSVSPVPTADIQTFIMGRAGTARGGSKHDGQEGRAGCNGKRVRTRTHRREPRRLGLRLSSPRAGPRLWYTDVPGRPDARMLSYMSVPGVV